MTSQIFKTHPRIILFFYFAWLSIEVFFIGVDRDLFGIAKHTVKIARFMDEALICLMLFFCFMHCIKGYSIYGKRVFFIIILLFMSFQMSVVANNAGVGSSIKFVTLYFKIFIVFFFTLIFSPYNKVNFKKVLTIYLIFILVQFIMNLGWFLRISPIPNIRREMIFNVDWASGTLISQSDIAFINLPLILFAIYGLINLKKFKMGAIILYCIFIIIGFIQLIWTDQKHVIFLFGISFLICYLLLIKKNYIRKLFVLIFFGVNFLALIYFRQSQYGVTSFKDSLIDGYNTINYAFKILRSTPKAQAYNDVIFNVPKKVNFPIFGAGPGKLNSKIAYETKPKLAELYTFKNFDNVHQKGGVATWFFPNTGVLVIYGELGILAFIAYFGAHLFLLINIWTNLKKGYYKQNYFTEHIAFAYCGFMVFWLLEALLVDLLFVGVAAPFLWILGGMLYKPKLSEKKIT